MKYQSELINQIVEEKGHTTSLPHYESECVETWIAEEKGAYPKLTDYKGEWLNYIVENPIGKFPYVTLSNVTDATVNNVVPYSFKSAILKGQTLVNSRGNTVSSIGWSTTDGIEYIVEGNNLFLNFECTLLPNTKYLIFFEFDGRGVGVQYGTRPANGAWDSAYSTTTDGICKKAITTGSDSKWLSFIVPNSFTVTDYVKISRIMIIPYQDGMENWDIPYFEGMQSVKMPVLTTTGKNLFNKDDIIVDGYIISNGSLVYQENDNRNATNFIEVMPNTTYMLSGIKNSAINAQNTHMYVGAYDENEDFIKSFVIVCNNDYATITTEANTKYIRFTVRNEDVNRLQLEQGALRTSYEPFKSNILSASEDVTLRGIGDVQDTLDCLMGEVTERIGEIVLDGSQNVASWWDTTSTVGVSISIPTMKNISKLVCDRLPVVSYKDINNGTYDTDGIASWDSGNVVRFRILKSKLTKENVNGVISYLQSNPITLQYELKTPIVKTVDLSVVNQYGNKLMRIRPIEGTMNVSTSSDTIHPTFSGEIPVEAITQNLSSFIEE